jgi:hypothetical protein
MNEVQRGAVYGPPLSFLAPAYDQNPIWVTVQILDGGGLGNTYAPVELPIALC